MRPLLFWLSCCLFRFGGVCGGFWSGRRCWVACCLQVGPQHRSPAACSFERPALLGVVGRGTQTGELPLIRATQWLGAGGGAGKDGGWITNSASTDLYGTRRYVSRCVCCVCEGNGQNWRVDRLLWSNLEWLRCVFGTLLMDVVTPPFKRKC